MLQRLKTTVWQEDPRKTVIALAINTGMSEIKRTTFYGVQSRMGIQRSDGNCDLMELPVTGPNRRGDWPIFQWPPRKIGFR